MLYLIVTGHRILARRWRGHSGEIDLVARRRRPAAVLRGEISPRQSQQRRADSQTAAPDLSRGAGIRGAAAPGAAFEWRFDLIRVSLPGRGGLAPLHHLKDAWRCDG